MSRLMLLPLAAVVAIVVGCGGAASGGGGESASADMTEASAAVTTTDRADSGGEPATAQSRKGKRIKVVDSEFGRVVADGKGEALYLFDKETRPRSRCYGHCAEVWPPVLTKGRPSAGAGADAALLGTTKRANGKLQVTYAGQPLYYYVGDSPGVILCHDVFEFGGDWLVLDPAGKAVA